MLARLGFAIITIALVLYLWFGPPVHERDRIGDGAFGSEVGDEIKAEINALVDEAREGNLNNIGYGENDPDIQARRLDWLQRSHMYEADGVHNGVVYVVVADDWQTWSHQDDFVEVAACYVFYKYPEHGIKDDLLSFIVFDDWGQQDPRRTEHIDVGYLLKR